MHRRRTLGPAAFYVATLVVVLVAVGLFAVAKSQEHPRSLAPTTAPGALSPLDEALQGISDDGTWSKDTALAVFAAAFGPLPSVPTPRPDSSYRSGTLAIRMIQPYWSDISADQKQAIRDYIGPAATTAVPAAFHPLFADLQATYQQIVDADVAEVGKAFGRNLGIPVPVIIGGGENGQAWAWATGTWPIGQRASGCSMTVPPSTVNDPTRQPYLRWVFMHEVWHCFEYQMIDFKTNAANGPWVTEGEANWVAEAITNGTGAPPPANDHWREYIIDPAKPLYARSYDGMGFYAQLAQAGIDPWAVLEKMVKAGGNDAAFEASGANAASFTDRWGSSWFRDIQPTKDWAMTDGYGIPPLPRATRAAMVIGDGDEKSFEAKPVSASIVDLHTTAFITRVQVPAGTGRVGEPRAGGLDKVVRGDTLDLCTNPSGDCTCPPGSSPLRDTPPERAAADLRVAATGEEHTTSIVDLRGISKDEWCTPTPSAPQGEKPCASGGCGGSNGDPHLRTIDGIRYDLQAAGEYVLLRSADGTLEIQGRQERPDATGVATIGSAVAVRVNGHRIGFYAAGAGPPEVHVDGVVVDAAKVASSDFGSGASLVGYTKGYELDLPDGTKVWALSIGHWGINLLVQPSATLRASGVGLLSKIPANAGYRVPAMPDGSVFPVPIDRHTKYHDLYDLLAPAWRVTAATTLFDYATGKTTDSYSLPGFPPEAVPQSSADLDPTAFAAAQTTCGAVTDPELLDQCAYDVTVTGSTEYATLYGVTDTFQAQGTTSLGPPTSGGTATPPPPVGGPTAGILPVADHLVGIGSAVLGPDGTLYVYVAEQGPSITDFKPALLAVDSATGKVKTKVPAAAVGMLAFAAGSLWAGDFNRGDVFCEVSRLDPVTLAVQAQVPTVCSDRDNSEFATIGGAVWFIDRTGSDANDAGGHLRRIDPATNKVDPSPSGNLDLPNAPSAIGVPGTASIFASTSDGLIIGNRQHGLYRLSTGSGDLAQIDIPATGSRLFPAGAGVWTQTEIGTSGAPEGVATFAQGDAGSDVKLGINGDLVGADDSAIYASPEKEDQDLDQLWRYPTDGSPATMVASSGLVPSGFGGQLVLLYRDPGLPLLVGDHLLVKLWQAASQNADAGLSLVIQTIPVP